MVRTDAEGWRATLELKDGEQSGGTYYNVKIGGDTHTRASCARLVPIQRKVMLDFTHRRLALNRNLKIHLRLTALNPCHSAFPG